ncbi:MAG: hypothetical protein BWX70_01321 [Verrucomicrobia bacterium ADurb.Bin070]|nr:MAG: hypothetical protein BWX70_01321 [Verrucomicrobia bacterium ADurb.Bin070]
MIVATHVPAGATSSLTSSKNGLLLLLLCSCSTAMMHLPFTGLCHFQARRRPAAPRPL